MVFVMACELTYMLFLLFFPVQAGEEIPERTKRILQRSVELSRTFSPRVFAVSGWVVLRPLGHHQVQYKQHA